MTILPTEPSSIDTFSRRFYRSFDARQCTAFASCVQRYRACFTTSSRHDRTSRTSSLHNARPSSVHDRGKLSEPSEPTSNSPGSTVRLVRCSKFQRTVDFRSLFRRRSADCTADGVPLRARGEVRGCQPTGRAAGEYWHLFSHRYLLSSAKHGPTLSHYHERLRHTGHGIENSTVCSALFPSFLDLSGHPHPRVSALKLRFVRSINECGDELSTSTALRKFKGILSRRRKLPRARPFAWRRRNWRGRATIVRKFVRRLLPPGGTSRGTPFDLSATRSR